MKRRTKQQPGARVGEKMRFLEIEQPRMLCIYDRQVHTSDRERFQGAYVKVAPNILASQKSEYDATAIRRQLLAAGAAAVVIAPTIVPDAPEKADEPRVDGAAPTTPEEHLKRWFASVKGSPQPIVDEALDQALTTLSEVGL